MKNQTVNEGKTTAIISYLWWIGFIIAFIINSSKNNSFASFHIRQSLGINLLSVVASLVSAYVNPSIGWVISVGVIMSWIIGLIGSIQGEEKKVPLLGDQFQEWLKNIG